MSDKTNFRDLKVFQALFLMLIPLILILQNNGEVEKSISDFASVTPLQFALLLTISSLLFIYGGYIERKRWYNIYIGFALLGVVWFNNIDFPILHYVFAGAFFLGDLLNMIVFSSKNQRPYKIIVALLVLFAFMGHYVFGWYSLFYAEWIGMVKISGHFVLEEFDVID